MNPERLLQNFDRLNDTPDAVPRLRRFILDLAVRGKLVEQNPEDEPAAELLKRIEVEKARLVKAEKIGKQRVVATLNLSDHPFNIPPTWKWIRLGQVANLITKGSTPTSYGHSFVNSGINFIKVESIRNGWLSTENVTSFITQKTHEFLRRSQLEKGDFLFSIAGSIGTCALVSEAILPANTNQALAIIRGADSAFLIDFLQYSSRSCLLEFAVNKARGGAMNNISLEDVGNFPLPLPPIAEQHRIVEKVDELMKLCDELEATQAKRERQRDRLVALTLHGLNNGKTDDKIGESFSFEDSARLYFNHLPSLTTRTEHIQLLRQTILNLAVRGKLVPQDPTEIVQINCVAKREIKKTSAELKEDTWPHVLPASWRWQRLEALAIQVTDGEHATPHRITEQQVPLVTAKNVRNGKMDYTNTDWVAYETATTAWQRCRPQVGDILLVCVGATTGRLCVLREPKDMVLVRSVALIRPNDSVDVDFMAVVLRSPMCQTQIWNKVKVTAQPCLYINRINSLAVPVPPLAEQHRIVAKVDEMMALCDEMEARINSNTTTSRQLLDATLQEVLDGCIQVA